MTDKQWEGMLKMVRGIMEKCTSLEEAIAFVDNLLKDDKDDKKEENRK